MAELGELLGTILTSVAHARRMADEETAALAEYYKDHPLLEGMAVPRIRVPEMVLDLPVVIDSHEGADTTVSEAPTKVRAAILQRFESASKSAGVKPPAAFKARLRSNLDRQLKVMSPARGGGPRSSSSESVVRAAEIAYAATIRELGPAYRAAVPVDKERIIRTEIRDQAKKSALKKRGNPPKINATIMTSHVKERADHNNVTRLKLVIKEEGVEWATSESEDGTVRRNLTPE